MKTNITLLAVLAICGWFAYQNMSRKQVAHVEGVRTEVAAVLVQAANVVSPSTNTVAAIVPKPEPVAEISATLPKPPQDWEVAGRTYHNVTVTKVEADCAHITYDGGVGSIMLADMLPDLRKCFRYDAVAARAAYEAKEAARNAAIAAMPVEPKSIVSEATPSTVAAVAQVKPSVDRASIQVLIDGLTQDMASKQAEIDRNQWRENSHESGSQGAYRDAIAADQQQIAALTQQMNR